jgi:hypothetical protein
LVQRHEEARKECITPPEMFFILGRRKVKSGHYDFDIDEAAIQG